MRPAQDSNDAAFRPLRAGDAAQTLDLCQHLVAVHGVLDGVAWNENVAVEVRHGRIRHDEAVAVVVKDQAAFYFIATREWRGLETARRVLGLSLAARLLFRLGTWEAVPPARQFLDGAPLLELGKHLEQRAIVSFLQMQSLRDFARRRGIASNLQKTQYVIGA